MIIKNVEYVPSHVHLNLTYLFEDNENEVLKIKADKNSDDQWVNDKEIENIVNEQWVATNIYRKLNQKLLKFEDA